MNVWMQTLLLIAMLGVGLIAGVFFAFSTFVMQGLGKLPPTHGMRAMQQINVTVLTPWFLGVFVGTLLLGVVLLAVGIWQWQSVASVWLIAGAVAYGVGTFLVTGLFNVPLNDRLAAMDTNLPEAQTLWDLYQDRWMLWNHVRTLAAGVATVCWAVGFRLL